MLTIAFDVGVKNLSYCCLDQDGKIAHWEVINIKEGLDEKASKDFHVLSQRLFEKLHQHFNYDKDIREVVIENQPVYKNPTMKSIQMLVYSFFGMRNIHLERKINMHFIGASTKVKLAEKYLNVVCPDMTTQVKNRYKNKYSYNKHVSIRCVDRLLSDEGALSDESFRRLFQSSKKKDDLADALLLGLVHMKRKLI